MVLQTTMKAFAPIYTTYTHTGTIFRHISNVQHSFSHTDWNIIKANDLVTDKFLNIQNTFTFTYEYYYYSGFNPTGLFL